MDDTVKPTRIDQRVRLVGFGGNVRAWHCECGHGIVEGFTRAGNPRIRLSGSTVLMNTGQQSITVVDTFGCARVVNDSGTLERSA